MPRRDGTGPRNKELGVGGFGLMARGGHRPCGVGNVGVGCRRWPVQETVALLDGRILFLEEELKELRTRRDALMAEEVSR